jgi:hypothetical protein
LVLFSNPGLVNRFCEKLKGEKASKMEKTTRDLTKFPL